MIRKIKLLISSLTMLFAVLALFININPLNAQWVSTGGPGPGATVTCFASNSTYFFTGTWGGPNGYYGGVFRTSNNGTNWIAVNSGLTDTIINDFEVNGSYLFTGTLNSGVFRSSNDGTNWISVNNGLTNLTVYSLGKSGNNLYAGTQDGIFRSTNDGISWAFTGLTGYLIFAIESIGSNVFAGTSGSGVFRTTNNGINWIEVNTGLTNTAIQCFTVMGTNLIAGTFSGVFYTTNNGTNWINTLGMSGTIVNGLSVSGTNLFAGSAGGGIHLSTNYGSNWTSVGFGIPNTQVNTLAINGTNIFAGTLSGIVYRRPLEEMISAVKLLSNELPADFYLSQNYPNPFNPVTKVRFEISHLEFIRLVIYNSIGQEIKTLVNESLSAGTYEAEFDGSDLPSGVYYYRLSAYSGANEFAETKKMLLIK